MDNFAKKNIVYWYVGSHYICGVCLVNGALILGRDGHACDFGSVIQLTGLTLEDKINLCLERERLVNEEGMTRAEAARALKVAPSTMDKWIRDYRDELGIQKLSFSECGHRRWERERKADAAEQEHG